MILPKFVIHVIACSCDGSKQSNPVFTFCNCNAMQCNAMHHVLRAQVEFSEVSHYAYFNGTDWGMPYPQNYTTLDWSNYLSRNCDMSKTCVNQLCVSDEHRQRQARPGLT